MCGMQSLILVSGLQCRKWPWEDHSKCRQALKGRNTLLSSRRNTLGNEKVALMGSKRMIKPYCCAGRKEMAVGRADSGCKLKGITWHLTEWQTYVVADGSRESRKQSGIHCVYIMCCDAATEHLVHLLCNFSPIASISVPSQVVLFLPWCLSVLQSHKCSVTWPLHSWDQSGALLILFFSNACWVCLSSSEGFRWVL